MKDCPFRVTGIQFGKRKRFLHRGDNHMKYKNKWGTFFIGK